MSVSTIPGARGKQAGEAIRAKLQGQRRTMPTEPIILEMNPAGDVVESDFGCTVAARSHRYLDECSKTGYARGYGYKLGFFA